MHKNSKTIAVNHASDIFDVNICFLTLFTFVTVAVSFRNTPTDRSLDQNITHYAGKTASTGTVNIYLT